MQAVHAYEWMTVPTLSFSIFNLGRKCGFLHFISSYHDVGNTIKERIFLNYNVQHFKLHDPNPMVGQKIFFSRKIAKIYYALTIDIFLQKQA